MKISEEIEAEKLVPFDDNHEPKEHNSSKLQLSGQVFWLTMWFFHNIGITFLNKRALTSINLPATLTFVHMVCNAVGAYIYIHQCKKVQRKNLSAEEKSLLFYFSLIFVSNIITGNWSLGLVSVSFNQVMRALVPGTTLVLSVVVLKKKFSLERKLSLIPIAVGVVIACTGEKTFTTFGFIITAIAVFFAAVKAVLSSKFLTGELNLHPMDLILHQAPISACWCCAAVILNGEWKVLVRDWHQIYPQLHWFIITGILSFSMNVTSFFANKVTSALSLAVCANVKQVMIIVLSVMISGDFITAQKGLGILIVILGGAVYTTISIRERNNQQG